MTIALANDNIDLNCNSNKAMLRAMFSRHHRELAKIARTNKNEKKAALHYFKARKLESKIADYANELIY